MKKLLLLIIISAAIPAPGAEDMQKGIVRLQLEKLAQQLVSAIPAGEGPVSIAVLDFGTSRGKASVQQLGKALAMILNETLGKDPRFIVIERQKLDELAKEISLGQTGLVDEATAAQAGKTLGARLVVTGTIVELGEHFLVAARTIAVETAEIQAIANIEIQQEQMIALSSKYVVIKKYSIVPALQSAIIPGWGQIYNDQVTKGGILIALGAVSGITYAGSLFFWILQTDRYESFISTEPDRSDIKREYRKLAMMAKVNRAAFVSCLAIWSFASIDAFIVSHRQLKQYRKEPQAIRLEPVIEPSAQEDSYYGAVLTVAF
jgi:TolB-like protein